MYIENSAPNWYRFISAHFWGVINAPDAPSEISAIVIGKVIVKNVF